MKTASAISTGLHLAVLAFAVVSFSGKNFDVTPAESLPVDMISEKEFSELTKGVKDAPKKEEPKPLVEKKAEEVKPVEDVKPKVAEKPEIKATQEKPAPPPVPEQKPAEAKESKAAEKPPEVPAKDKADPIADKLKQQAQAQPAPLPPKKPPQKQQPKFDADKIAALLDQREPRRQAAVGDTLSSAPSLGAAMGNAAQLSQSELDALRARLMALWNPPVGITNPEDYVIRIRIKLSRDGKLSAPPAVLTSGHGVLFTTARDSAIRAVFRGQPFDMLKPEHYETWKDIEVTFDPRDMFRG
ncbi:MAG: cell envelope biogenesis protein TolA [Pseudolabrys sp.]